MHVRLSSDARRLLFGVCAYLSPNLFYVRAWRALARLCISQARLSTRFSNMISTQILLVYVLCAIEKKYFKERTTHNYIG